MRGLLVALGAFGVVLAASPAGAQAQPAPAQQALASGLSQGMSQEGPASGAYVVDLTAGQVLFASAANVPRLPASVEKLYTTATALLRFGPHATLATSVLGRGYRGRAGR